jgi:hypothetical protein
MAGILTNEQEKVLAGKLDDLIKLKGILEIIDGYVFKAVITLLDDKLIDKLPDTLKVKLAELADALIGNDLDKAVGISADLINGLVDVPGLDEESEGLLLKGILELIVGAVLQYIEGIKGSKVYLSEV